MGKDRKETTAWLGRLLEKYIHKKRMYCATEVCIDYGTEDIKRIDYLAYKPANTQSVAGIERGMFTCFEIKSCKADFNSGYGKNFIGDENYFVMDMPTYISLLPKTEEDLKKPGPADGGTGVLVAIPEGANIHEEFQNPHTPDGSDDWTLYPLFRARAQPRKRSVAELLFLMMRAWHD